MPEFIVLPISNSTQDLADFLKQLSSVKDNTNLLAMDSYLIVPVQRILKLKLLLEVCIIG